MLKKILLLFLFFYSINSFSQFEVKGIIVDDKGPIEFANIILIKNGNDKLEGTITDENGTFSIKLNAGTYNLKIKFLGYTTKTLDVNLESNIDIGQVVITKENNVLNEVVINSNKPLIERKVDRIVFNLNKSSIVSGGDAIDALKVTPNVSVRNDQLTLLGKRNLSVLLDGRLLFLSGSELFEFLRSLSADTIESIEVITNPPAKYDAEGNSGLINIVLKKVKKDSWSSSINYTYEQGIFAVNRGRGYFNYRKNKLSVSTNIGYSYGSRFSRDEEEIRYPITLWDGKSRNREFSDVLSGKIGLGYELNDKVKLGIQYIGSNSKPDYIENNIVRLTNRNSNSLDSTLTTRREILRKNTSSILNFYTQVDFDTIGTRLNLNVDYLNYRKQNDQLFTTNTLIVDTQESFIDQLNNTGDEKISNLSFSVDVEQPLEFLNLNYGTKLSFTNTNNDINFFNIEVGELIEDLNRSNIFNYQENTYALYISGTKKIKKIDIKAGLRFEATFSEGNSITLSERNDNDYAKLFPTFFVSYVLNDSNSFSVNYGRRVNRPRFTMLNPFRVFNNPFSSVQGNPFLQPSFTHNIEFGHTFKGNYNTTLFYSYTVDDFGLLTEVEENTSNQISIPVNFLEGLDVGIRESFSIPILEWWNTFNSLVFSFNRNFSNNPITDNVVEGFGGSVFSSSTFYFNKSKSFSGNLDLFYAFPSTFGISRNGDIFSADAGVRYKLKKKFTFNVSIRDIFRTNRNLWTQNINGIRIRRLNFQDRQVVKFSVKYDFGNRKIRSKNIQAKNNNERRRVN